MGGGKGRAISVNRFSAGDYVSDPNKVEGNNRYTPADVENSLNNLMNIAGNAVQAMYDSFGDEEEYMRIDPAILFNPVNSDYFVTAFDTLTSLEQQYAYGTFGSPDYPFVLEVRLGNAQGGVAGYSTLGSLELNFESYADLGSNFNMAQRNVGKGFWSSGSGLAKTSLEAVIVHEYGHAIFQNLSQQQQKSITNYFNEAKSSQDVYKTPSKYGMTNKFEFFAESFVNAHYYSENYSGLGSESANFVRGFLG